MSIPSRGCRQLFSLSAASWPRGDRAVDRACAWPSLLETRWNSGSFDPSMRTLGGEVIRGRWAGHSSEVACRRRSQSTALLYSRAVRMGGVTPLYKRSDNQACTSPTRCPGVSDAVNFIEVLWLDKLIVRGPGWSAGKRVVRSRRGPGALEELGSSHGNCM